jgi:hypothetical protein
VEFQTKVCQEGTSARVTDSRRILRIAEHLEGGIVQRREQREDTYRISENSIEIC